MKNIEIVNKTNLKTTNISLSMHNRVAVFA